MLTKDQLKNFRGRLGNLRKKAYELGAKFPVRVFVLVEAEGQFYTYCSEASAS